MTGTSFDRERFGKVLALAESPNDGEALAAIRMATKLARVAGLSLGQAIEAPIIRDIRERDTGKAGHKELSEAYEAGLQAGLRVGAKELKTALRKQVEDLETELEAYRAECPWPDLAENYFFANQRGGRKDFAKGLILRSRTNRLQPEDHAELRRWDDARQRRSRKSAA